MTATTQAPWCINGNKLTENCHLTYLGEISWKVPVTPQVNTCDMQFILIVDGSPCLEREIRMINISHIVTGVVKRTLIN